MVSKIKFILVLAISIVFTEAKSYSQSNDVYRYQAGEVDVNNNYVPASSIPSSLPKSEYKRLLYVLSANLGPNESYSFKEEFTNLKPLNGFTFNTSKSESHYFALVDEEKVNSISFWTTLLKNGYSFCCPRNPVTISDYEEGQMHLLNDFNDIDGYTNKMWVGIAPLRPTTFNIKNKPKKGADGSFVIDKATGGDAIQFELASTNSSQYVIEVSNNGRTSWETLPLSTDGSSYTIKPFDKDGHSVISGSNRIYFRARTYNSPNSIVGRSYGYREIWIDVFPKPECTNINDIYLCSDQPNLTGDFEVKGIQTESGVDSIRVSVEKYSVEKKRYEIIGGMEEIIPVDQKQITFTSANLDSGKYRVVLENRFITPDGENAYDCGHSFNKFEIIQRENLQDFFTNDISIDCSNSEKAIDLYIENTDPPTNITLKTCDNNYENCSVIDSPNEFTVSPGTYYIVAEYTTEPTCREEFDIDVTNTYPQVTINRLGITYGCNGANDVFVIKDKDYKVGTGTSTDYYIQYKVGNNHDWTSIDTTIIDKYDAGEVIATIGVFVGNDVNPTCEYSKFFDYNPLSKIEYNVSVTHVTYCSAANNGSIALSNPKNALFPCVVNLEGPENRTLDWEAEEDNLVFNELPAGDYNITLTDALGCFLSKDTTIKTPDYPFSLESYDVSNVSPCSYSTNGNISIKTTGQGSDSFQVSVDNEKWDEVDAVYGLNAGYYTIYARPKDVQACVVSQGSIPVGAPAPLALFGNTTNPSCSYSSNGSIELSHTPEGQVSYYQLVNNSHKPVLSTVDALAQGTYKFFAVDASGCYSDTVSIEVKAPTTLLVEGIVTTPPNCHGDKGVVNFTISGGTAPYSCVFTCTTDGSFTQTLNDQMAGNVSDSLPSGSYLLKVTDGHNCVSDEYEFEIGETNPISIYFSEPEYNGYYIQCNGDTALYSVSISGGTPNYTLHASNSTEPYNSNGESILFSSPADTVEYWVIDSNNCKSDTIELIINQPEELLIESLEHTPPTCYDGNNGEIVVYASGGVNPYNYKATVKSSGSEILQTEQTFSDLAAGEYLITVEDANGCQSVPKLDTLPNAAEMTLTLTATSTSCHGGNDGSISVTLEGEEGLQRIVAIYPGSFSDFDLIDVDPQYSIQTYGNSHVFSDLLSGDYTVTFTYPESECIQLDTIHVSQPEELSYTIAPINVQCNNTSTGKVSVQIEGGNTPYNLTLFDISENQIGSISTVESDYLFEGLSEKYYYVQLSDSKGCSVFPPPDTLVFVSNPPEEFSIALEQQPADCFNTPTGAILATAQGGWSGYSFSINNSEWITIEPDHNTYTFNKLMADKYQISVRDGNYCLITQSIDVMQPEELLIDSISVSPTSCFGGSNGSLTVYSSGGNGGNLYSIGDNFEETNIFNGLTAGAYTVEVRDSKGCSATVDNVNIVQPQEFSLDVIANNYNGYSIPCYGGTDSVRFAPKGATPPYSFSINDSIVGVCGLNDTFLVSNLSATEYSVLVIDGNGCEYTHSFELVQPDSLSFSNITLVKPLCYNGFDGSIEIDGMEGGVPGFEFWLYDQSFEILESTSNVISYTFEGLNSQGYTISAADANGCSVNSSVSLGQPTEINIGEYNIVNNKCKGDSSGSIRVTVNGGTGFYSYKWFNSSNELVSTQNPLDNQPAGVYTLIVTDSNGCFTNSSEGDSFEILEPDEALLISNVQLVQPTCYGDSNGSISITSSGGWDSNHCYGINDESFGPSSEFLYLPTGTYPLSVKDGMGCIATDSVTLEQPDLLELFPQSVSDAACYGESNGEVVLDATGGNGGYSYGFTAQPLNPSPVFSNLSAGSYSFWVSDSKGCVNSTQVAIAEPLPITFSIVDVVEPLCGNSSGSFNVVAMGGNAPFSIAWTSHSLPSLFTQFDLAADRYKFTITDNNGCNQSFNYNLNSNGGPSVLGYSIVEPTCSYRNDGSIEINIESNAPVESITWIDSNNNSWDGNSVANNLLVGNYTVKITDKQGCVSFTDSIMLSGPDPMSAPIIASPVICFGENTGSLSTSLQGGTYPYSVQWFNSSNQLVGNNTKVDNLGPGIYSLIVSDSNGCGFTTDNDQAVLGIEINQPEQPLVNNLLSMQEPTCFEGSNAQLALSAQGGWGNYRYSLNGSAPSSVPVFKHLSAGVYDATVTDMYGCAAALSVEVTQPNPIQVDILEKDDVTCFGESNGMIRVMAVNGMSPYSFSANDGETWNNHGVFNNLPFGHYNIVAKDLYECVGSFSATVNQPNPLVASVDTLSPAYCGADNGWVVIDVDGGTAPFITQWNHLETSQELTVEGLSPGTYSASVIDANQCTGDISITVPEVDGPEIHSFEVESPTCFGFDDGSVEFDFSGVSSPFNFFLNGTMVNSHLVQGLPSGSYIFTVVDKYSCADSITIIIDEPEDIAVGFIDINPPICDGQANGFVTVNAVGGTPPYSFAWSTGIAGSTLNNAAAGLYSVLVTDYNQCVKESEIELVNSHPVVIDLPSLVALCQGQSVTLDAQNHGSMFWWTSNNSFQSFDRVVTIADEGEYYLQVTHENGCIGLDTVAISKYDYVVSSTLLVPGTAMVGDTVVVIDISWPMPELIEWVIPNEFTVLLDNPYEKHLIPNVEGKFTLTLIASTGECIAISQKNITVNGFNIPPLPREANETLIKWVNIMPNPAHHVTNIEVALNREASITIQLFNSYGFPIKFVELSNSDFYSYRLPLSGFAPGIYLVKVVAEDSQQTVRLIVN